MAGKHELNQKGLRLTPQRELVLQAVRILGHSTPESILEYVRKNHPGINLSTVYRNLETLENVGLVQHSHISHGSANYHATEVLDHFHLVCHDCGSHIDAPRKAAEEFIASIKNQFEFTVDITHYAVSGICSKCLDHSPNNI
jgi:Fur family ferric uptake transcriptional regulator